VKWRVKGKGKGEGEGDLGEYPDDDVWQVSALRELLVLSIQRAERVVRSFSGLFKSCPEAIRRVVGEVVRSCEVRGLLGMPCVDAWKGLFLEPLRRRGAVTAGFGVVYGGAGFWEDFLGAVWVRGG
jgi:hypothetical protein